MSELYFNTACGKQCSLNRKKYTRIQNVYTVSLPLKRQSQQKYSVLLAAEMFKMLFQTVLTQIRLFVSLLTIVINVIKYLQETA